VALRPDLVVVDREENRRDDAAALEAAGMRLHVTAVVALDGVPSTLRELASAVGAAVPDIAIGPPEPTWATAFVPIWRRPWMTINAETYGSTVLAHLGVDNVFAGHHDRYPSVELGHVAELAPELVLLPTEPYSFRASHIDELRRALPDAAVHVIDGQDLFWWGVRTPAAVERLRAALRAAPPRR
jgi:ABC-type hemin transport system substrate-binding protein